MGGMRALLPRTYWAFLIGALALVGIPPFAGFFSKDSILAAAMDHGWYGYVLWIAGLAGAFLTGVYTFRMLFMVFWGEPSAFVREHFHALKRDVPGIALEAPVFVLALLSIVGGWLQFAPLWHPVESWLHTVAAPLVSPSNWQEAVSSILAVVLGLGGIGVAWLLYGAPRRRAVLRSAFWQRTLEHKFYFDEAYDALFYAPSSFVARALGFGVEQPLILGGTADVGTETREAGGLLARLQTGLLRTYALAIASSVAVLAIVFVAVK
jgi:NADH-quinone oxidoreductase subunit L